MPSVVRSVNNHTPIFNQPQARYPTSDCRSVLDIRPCFPNHETTIWKDPKWTSAGEIATLTHSIPPRRTVSPVQSDPDVWDVGCYNGMVARQRREIAASSFGHLLLSPGSAGHMPWVDQSTCVKPGTCVRTAGNFKTIQRCEDAPTGEDPFLMKRCRLAPSLEPSHVQLAS